MLDDCRIEIVSYPGSPEHDGEVIPLSPAQAAIFPSAYSYDHIADMGPLQTIGAVMLLRTSFTGRYGEPDEAPHRSVQHEAELRATRHDNGLIGVQELNPRFIESLI
ncbi:hypothetical protein GCM10007036_04780 [Alsobacter metallidurans]|uniref:Uncharacterized protein n=1 Tax=Alsobacter metallidurans TaxID=340221 RepID=A0A917I454_9HYPH|nr:hypothetical protein GCM10007036_04780 [Alsobacter metallidurans]